MPLIDREGLKVVDAAGGSSQTEEYNPSTAIPFDETVNGIRYVGSYRWPANSYTVSVTKRPDNTWEVINTLKPGNESLVKKRIDWVYYPDGSVDERFHLKGDALQSVPDQVFHYTKQEWEVYQLIRSDDFIKSLDPVTAFTLYYELLNWQPAEPGECPWLRPSSITPQAYAGRDVWHQTAIFGFESGVRIRIYNLRPDIRNIRDPSTGESVVALLNPNEFPRFNGQECVESNFSKYFRMVFFGLIGLAMPFALPVIALNALKMAMEIQNIKDTIARQNAVQVFVDLYLKGNAAVVNATVAGQLLTQPPVVPNPVVTPATTGQPIVNTTPNQSVGQPKTQTSSKSIVPILLVIAAAVFGS